MKELKPRIHENGMDYVLVGDYYVPDLKLPEERRPIGHWGRLRQSYLKPHGADRAVTGRAKRRDRSHESGKSDVMGAVNELHPLPGRGNHQDGTNLLLREVKL